MSANIMGNYMNTAFFQTELLCRLCLPGTAKMQITRPDMKFADDRGVATGTQMAYTEVNILTPHLWNYGMHVYVMRAQQVTTSTTLYPHRIKANMLISFGHILGGRMDRIPCGEALANSDGRGL
jgi:hypothetical protein